MSWEVISRPVKGWRPSVRTIRGKGPFNDEQYRALLGTLDGTALRVVYRPAGNPEAAFRSHGTSNASWGIDSSVRVRLLDEEGYLMHSKRVDELSYGVWLERETLRCSATGQTVDCVEHAAKEHVRLRRGQKSPFHEHGVLLAGVGKRA